jgi:cytochrome c556
VGLGLGVGNFAQAAGENLQDIQKNASKLLGAYPEVWKNSQDYEESKAKLKKTLVINLME